MSILADRQYTLQDFGEVSRSNQLEDRQIPEDTIEIINRLAKLVGAPTYQRTPVFKKRDRRPPRARPTISAADWEEIRNFTTTKLEKNQEGIEMEIDNIRSSLNKITATNYVDMRENIVDVLRRVIESNVSEDELVKVGKSIFEIGSMNKFWSKLYAELYKDLIETFAPMQEIYRKNFIAFLSLFDNIRYVSADESYDEFCRVNKENENRRAMGSFFVHLMSYGVIQTIEMLELIDSLKNKFTALIGQEDKKNEAAEIAENLVILIGNGKDDFEGTEQWDKILEFVGDIVKASIHSNPSLTNQTKFKFMDLEDEL